MSDNNNTKDSNNYTYVPYKDKLGDGISSGLTTLQRTPYVGLSAREAVQYSTNDAGDFIDADRRSNRRFLFSKWRNNIIF